MNIVQHPVVTFEHRGIDCPRTTSDLRILLYSRINQGLIRRADTEGVTQDYRSFQASQLLYLNQARTFTETVYYMGRRRYLFKKHILLMG